VWKTSIFLISFLVTENFNLLIFFLIGSKVRIFIFSLIFDNLKEYIPQQEPTSKKNQPYVHL
jgi:hypothetical protein